MSSLAELTSIWSRRLMAQAFQHGGRMQQALATTGAYRLLFLMPHLPAMAQQALRWQLRTYPQAMATTSRTSIFLLKMPVSG